MLRAKQVGFSVADLEQITLGMLFDTFAELGIDNEEREKEESGVREATQADFDRF